MSDPKALAQSPNLGAIDAFRGYAILLVIASHVIGQIPELVWPVRRLMLMGFFGVQLFFIASAVTLMMSWARSSQPLAKKCRVFFVHRIFRIAPLYFLAIGFYWLFNGNVSGDFNAATLLATLFFYNAWSPYLLPTTGGWTPVPGGWSIGVEFCFYLIFPLLAQIVTSRRRALVFVLSAVAMMALVPVIGATLYPEISQEQRANFLYFSFPNQLAIFAIGFFLYHCLPTQTSTGHAQTGRINALKATLFLLACIVLLSFFGPSKFLDLRVPVLPTHLLLAIVFALWMFVLMRQPDRLVVNALIVAIGKMSFSMYILHFAVLHFLGAAVQRLWPGKLVPMLTVLYAGALFVAATALTYAVATLTNRLIELPGIQLGKKLLSKKAKTSAATL